MIQDPYKVLGVSPNASDDEIKKAYRTLAKKYHPDLNPGDKVAEQKMNEVNAAYEQIKNPPQGGFGGFGGYSGQSSYGGSQSTGSYGGFGGFGTGFGGFGGFGGSGYYGGSSSYGGDEPTAHKAAINYIRTRHFNEALVALDGVPLNERTARWYYLASLANYGLGNKIRAIEMAERAHAMEPDNDEYIDLIEELKNGGTYYRTYSSGMGGANFGNNLCMSLIAFNMFRLCCPCC